MKRRILLTVLMSLLMVVLSYGETPKELETSNKALKYKNLVETFKNVVRQYICDKKIKKIERFLI